MSGTERVTYPCQECGVLWLTPAAAWKCCERLHRGGRDAYSDELGRMAVQCHGRELHRVRRLARRMTGGAS